MRHRPLLSAATLSLALGASVAVAAAAGADGTETLGPPSVTLATGTGIVANGVGLFTQPASFPLAVPSDATVKQVLLYYEAGHRQGDASGDSPDRTITVNGQNVTVPTIGGPSPFYNDVLTATHRLDITDLHLINPGPNTVTVDGLDTDEVDDGAGVVVIYDRPGEPAAELRLADGNDVAFVNFPPPRDATVAQTFTFTAAAIDRSATVQLLATSVHDPVPAGFPQTDPKHRPNILRVTVAGTTTDYPNPFTDAQGREFDSATLAVSVPAGATALTLQMVSAYDATGDLPASLVWLVGAVAVQVPPAPTTTAAPAVVPTTAAPTTTAEVREVSDSALPFTGSEPWPLAAVGITVLGAGAAVVLATRKRARRAGAA